MTQGQYRGQITIINNDSGSERSLPDAIREELVRFSQVHILGSGLPTADLFSDDIEVFSYADILLDQDDLGRFEKIAGQLIEESEKDDLLLLVNKGSTGKTEVCEELVKAASEERFRLRVVDSNGPFGALLLAAGLDMAGEFTVVDASRLARLHHPSFPPHIPAILPVLPDRNALERIKPVLQTVYPADHKVRIIQTGKNFEIFVKDSTLERMDASSITDSGAALIIPPMESEQSFEAFQEIIAHLRAPEGCPWDREQTHLTLRKNLLEETYEALTALDDEDIDGMREEFGDLVLQIVLHAQIAAEAGEFRMGDVLAGINRKLVHRHPHVFGETEVSGVKGVLQNWERLKEDERAAKGQHEKGQLDGVPINLPSLNQAQEIQSRAARVGFDWAEIKPVFEKVFEEIEEVRTAKNADETEKEIGDLLFAVVNLARWYRVDAESALRLTNLKFRKRFAYIEKIAREKGTRLAEMSLAEMDVLWEEAKGFD